MTLSLVTGGAGFIGGHLVDALKAKGERVRVLDLSAVAGEDCVTGSVVNPDAAARACDGVDFVFHLAGDAQLWSKDANRFEQVNVQGTQVMIDAAKKAGVKRFVQCSSMTTLVGKRTAIGASNADETMDLPLAEMLGPYPKSKARADALVRAAAADGLEAVIGIPTEPLGPGDRSLTPPSRLIVDLLNGRTPATIDCMLNFVDVRSLAGGFIAARDRGQKGHRYLFGGENLPMRSLLGKLEELTGKPMPRAQLPYAVALAAGAVDTYVVARLTGKAPTAPLTGVRLAGRRVSFSSKKAATELGWSAPPIESALKDAISWFEDEGHIRARQG